MADDDSDDMEIQIDTIDEDVEEEKDQIILPSPPKKESRAERIAGMEKILKNASLKLGDKLKPEQKQEMLTWAGIEFAAFDQVSSLGLRILRAVHPSIGSDTERLNIETSVFLAQVAAILGRKGGIPLDILVSSMVTYYRTSVDMDPSKEEIDDFERILYGNAN